MATLTNCKTCKKEISRNAKSCPHCGERFPSSSPSAVGAGCAGIVGILILIGAIGLATSGPDKNKDTPAATSESSDGSAPPPWTLVSLTPEQKMEGRRALCDAVRDEWSDIQAGTQGKDKFPMILAIQSFSLDGSDKTIADAAVRQEFAEYLQAKWREPDCPESARQRATGEKDEPLPDDAIDTALVKTDKWWYPNTQ